jgi:hypothetical protein
LGVVKDVIGADRAQHHHVGGAAHPGHLPDSNPIIPPEMKKQQYRVHFWFLRLAEPGSGFVARPRHAVEEGRDHEIENPNE